MRPQNLLLSLVALTCVGLVGSSIPVGAQSTPPKVTMISKSCAARSAAREKYLLDLQAELEKKWMDPSPRPQPAPVYPVPISESSTTNTQVVGIDEGDSVENDGRYIYAVVGGQLRVIDGTNGSVVANLGKADRSTQLILFKGRLLSIRSGIPYENTLISGVEIWDVSAPTLPQRLSQFVVTGTLGTIRSAEGRLNAVFTASFPFPDLGGSEYIPDDAERKRKAARNRAAIASDTQQWNLPGMVGPAFVRCSDIYFRSDSLGILTDITWFLQIDLRKSADRMVLLGGGVEGSFDSVFQAGEKSQSRMYLLPSKNARSAVAFDVAELGSPRMIGLVEFPGLVESELWIDDKDGFQRVVSVTNGPERNVLSIFRRSKDGFDEVAKVTGLGEEFETVRAVRFEGTKAYVITAQQTDPLYVLDLSNPMKPRKIGHIKIPGFSAYVQFVGNGRLIGAGQDEYGYGEASLFDVSNARKPRRLSTAQLGDSSLATADRHAFLWWPITNTLVLPIDESILDDAGEQIGQRGRVMVLSTVGGRLTRIGRVLHKGTDETIYRSMIVNNQLITLSNSAIKSTNLRTLKQNWYADSFDL
jgi:Beta propeller domain